jgi:hypothetical protein
MQTRDASLKRHTMTTRALTCPSAFVITFD